MNLIKEETNTNSADKKPIGTNTQIKNDQSQKTKPGFLTSLFERIVSNPFKRSSNNDTVDVITNNNNNNTKKGMNATGPPQALTQVHQTVSIPKRQCRHPVAKRFAHPCNCAVSSHLRLTLGNANGTLPSPPYTLFDTATRKCLPVAKGREMLLKECLIPRGTNITDLINDNAWCLSDDLICDQRRFRCSCKPPLHLYYEANHTSFGCVPIGPNRSPDGSLNCRSGQIYNVISKECQKIFDINELPPAYSSNVSATHFSYVTTVLIWILLLILIVTAKLRKLKASTVYHNGSPLERRSNVNGSRQRNNQNGSAWLHPFIAAVNGHYHMNHRRATMDRHSIDEQGNFNDTDFFLSNGGPRLNELLPDGHLPESHPSFENPPPKFEEIYPTDRKETARASTPPLSNEDLPTYDEAINLQCTTLPPDNNTKNVTQ